MILQPGHVTLAEWRAIYRGARADIDPACHAGIAASAAAVEAILARHEPVYGINTGFGKLAAATETYFRDGLKQASRGDRDALLVFYCQADCWMSWNAAKRAVDDGYRNVAWFPEGTDGWEQAGLPLVDAQPMPRLSPE